MTRKRETLITTDDSPVKVYVIPTDEELVFTEDVAAILDGTYTDHMNFEYTFPERISLGNKIAEAGKRRSLERKPENRKAVGDSPTAFSALPGRFQTIRAVALPILGPARP